MAKQKQVLNTAGTHVWMHNPETGGVWECPLDYAPVAEARGWEFTTEPDTSLDGLFDESSAEGELQTGFDPAEHGVAEVNAHLATYADTAPGEVERVLELERAGKNRTTVVDPRPGTDETTSTGD